MLSKRRFLTSLLMLLSLMLGIPKAACAQNLPAENFPTPFTYILPANFSVYTRVYTEVINHPAPGFVKKMLPTVNLYENDDGCYIAAYSHDANGSVYSVSPDIYVVGQIRVQGRYQGGICQPKGFEDQDISASRELKNLTDKYFPGRKGGTWPGGDTGGWFGISGRP